MRMSLVIGAVMAAGLAACDNTDSSTGPVMPVIVGTYTLTRFNGASVPTTVFTTGIGTASPTTWTLVSGTLELHADNTWAITYPMRFATGAQTGNADPIPHDVGRFTIAGNTLTMRDSTAGSTFTADVTASGVVMRAGLVNSFGFASLEFVRP